MGVSLPDVEWPVWEASEQWLNGTAREAEGVELWDGWGHSELF